ncbi:alkene reductase [Formicincola oecophyllae]|uniref:Alkene reductase n=1 Tax=Formicincola oecophyllae TaxID=2558361 RepID=A0A4Y6U7R1_9PROT|nr:alkene reductase [Formicincola oecophyllae]QDH13194.1 alkene reductase [Formicincola oecophyllae]
MTTLFDQLQLGAIPCKNRVFMAPLTRLRSTPDGVPTPLMAQYYAQRADAGLIIAESMAICQQGSGFLNAPGIWEQAQIKGWRLVTDAVHAAGGKIVAQLWHGGRIVFPTMNGGTQPVSASATQAPGLGHTWEGKEPYPMARALRLDEIPALVAQFAQAAQNAIKAGFDGVQVHAANGYLLDQFLRDSTNHRTDAYGGSVENRMRLLREVCVAVIGAVGAGRTGVRISPNGEILGCVDSNPKALFVPVAAMLQQLGVAWLGVKEFNPHADPNAPGPQQAPLSPEIRKVFTNPLVLNGNYDFQKAEQVVGTGKADAISFGRPFIANPDLVKRFEKLAQGQTANVAESDKKTWYGEFLPREEQSLGYTDYPTMNGLPCGPAGEPATD